MSPIALIRQTALWQKELPSVTPFYAIKCNPDPTILTALHKAGLNFDCASRRELLSVKDMGAGADRIVYANPCKSERDLEYAKELGSPVTVVDSLEELDKLKGYEGGALIRIAVDDRGSRMPFSSKFGAKPEHVPALSHMASQLGIPIHGISFHVGSGCYGGKPYGAAVTKAYECLQAVRKHHDASIIDIGGGFLPAAPDFQEKAKYIREAIIKIKNRDAWDGLKGVKMIAEPGRFFATTAYDFFVQVIGKKRGRNGWSYTIDDSIYGQFTSILFDHAKPTWVRIQEDTKPRNYSEGVLFGRTCDSVDVIARAEYMEELEVGDWLWFPAMGAYTRATASEFNGFPVPKVFVDSELVGINPLMFPAFPPNGVHYMPAVSASNFWPKHLFSKIDEVPPHYI